MKLKIEIDLTPDEIPTANELINTLKNLVSHVEAKVRASHGSLADTTVSFGVPEVGTQLQRLTQLISSVEDDDGKKLEDVATHIQKMFEDMEGDLVHKEKPVAPFVYLLSRIPEPFKMRARDALIQKILKFLTIKRAADCVRAEFFAHAEASAALVKLEFVSIKGAITTINTLLKKEDNMCAALTMLGKTVELCLDILTDKCDQGSLRELRQTLDNISDPAFEYDIAYIKENMNWQDLPVGSSGKPVQLVPHKSFEGHRNVIFSLAHDSSSDNVVSASKDGRVIMWSGDGKPQDFFELPQHYACSMDINPKHRILYMCGVSKEAQGSPANAHPAVIAYVLNDNNKWQQHGILEKPDTKVISSVKASIHGSGNKFVTGETLKDAHNEFTLSVVCCYDINSSHRMETLTPLTVLDEHQDIITCLAAVPRSEYSFLSGSRDCRVLMWDIRGSKSVGAFVGHEGTVTSVSASGDLIATGGLDKKILTFDIRALSSSSTQQRPMSTMLLDASAVLKVVFGNANEAAASTLLGLYQISFDTGASHQVQCFADPSNPSTLKATRYHDLAWNNDRSLLYAAGDDMRIDVYCKSNMTGNLL